MQLFKTDDGLVMVFRYDYKAEEVWAELTQNEPEAETIYVGPEFRATRPSPTAIRIIWK